MAKQNEQEKNVHAEENLNKNADNMQNYINELREKLRELRQAYTSKPPFSRWLTISAMRQKKALDMLDMRLVSADISEELFFDIDYEVPFELRVSLEEVLQYVYPEWFAQIKDEYKIETKKAPKRADLKKSEKAEEIEEEPLEEVKEEPKATPKVKPKNEPAPAPAEEIKDEEAPAPIEEIEEEPIEKPIEEQKKPSEKPKGDIDVEKYERVKETVTDAKETMQSRLENAQTPDKRGLAEYFYYRALEGNLADAKKNYEIDRIESMLSPVKVLEGRTKLCEDEAFSKVYEKLASEPITKERIDESYTEYLKGISLNTANLSLKIEPKELTHELSVPN